MRNIKVLSSNIETKTVINPIFNSGSYVNYLGNMTAFAAMQYSDIIEVSIGETIGVTCNGLNDGVAVLSRWNSDGKFIETLKLGVSNALFSFTYTADREKEYLKISCLTASACDVYITRQVDVVIKKSYELIKSQLSPYVNSYYAALFNNVIFIGDSLTAGAYYGG